MNKPIGIIVALAFTMTTAFGQGKDLTSAVNAFNSVSPMLQQAMRTGDFSKVKGKLIKCKEYIDAAYTKQMETNALKAKDIPKLHRYRAEIYMTYPMLGASDEEIAKEVENNEELFEEAVYGSAKKCKETDTNEMHFPVLKQKLNMMRFQSASMGSQMYNEGKYEEAYELFSGATEIGDVIDYVDTMSAYNAGLAAERIDKYDDAAKYYAYCAKHGYNGATTYVFLSRAYTAARKEDEAEKALSEGMEKYPANMDLLIEQLNGFLLNEEYDKAEESMAKAVAKEPNNPILQFSIGIIYDNLKKYEKAVKAFDAALAIDPNYFDAMYSKGVSYFKQSVDISDKVETLTDIVQQENETKVADGLMAKAMAVLEKAHGLNANDLNTMKALKQIYASFDRAEDYKAMKEKILQHKK